MLMFMSQISTHDCKRLWKLHKTAQQLQVLNLEISMHFPNKLMKRCCQCCIRSYRIVCHLCDKGHQNLLQKFFISKVHVWDVGLCFTAKAHWNSFTETNRGISGNGLNQGPQQTKIAGTACSLAFHLYAPYQLVPWPVVAQICSDHVVLLTQPVRHSSRWSMWPNFAWQSQWKSLQNTLAPRDAKDAKICQKWFQTYAGQKGAIPPVSRQNGWQWQSSHLVTHRIKTWNKCWSYLIRLPIHSNKHIPTEKCYVHRWCSMNFPCLQKSPKNTTPYPGLASRTARTSEMVTLAFCGVFSCASASHHPL